MTMQDLITLVLSKIKIIAGIAGFSCASYVMPVKYATNVRMYVKSSTNINTAGETNTAEIATAQKLAETYIIVLQDITTYEKISEKFSEDYDMEQLEGKVPLEENKATGEIWVSPSYIQSCVSISSVEETEVLNISATTEIPQIAVDICNYMTEVAPDVLMRVVKAGSVEAINEPKLPTSPVSPNVKKISAIGAMAGMLLTIAVIVLIKFLNNRVSTGAEVKAKFDVAILAEIPTFTKKIKKGAYK